MKYVGFTVNRPKTFLGLRVKIFKPFLSEHLELKTNESAIFNLIDFIVMEIGYRATKVYALK